MLHHPGDQVLSAFIDGTLAPPEVAPLEAHLLDCDECRKLVIALARTLRSGSQGSLPVEEPEALGPGAHVGRYRIEEVLGAGAMGMVYRAHDPELGRRVALKLVRAVGPVELQRALVLREAQALARLAHPNVVAVHDVAWLGERMCVAMELVEGGTLREWLRGAKRSSREILGVLLQAGRGLAAAHAAGLVHRDFKPENLMVGDDGRARVTDFGLVRMKGDAQETALIGSPAYMSPEQLAGEPAGPRSDLFSFCATAWEALSGERPFAGGSVGELGEAIARQDLRGAARVPKSVRQLLLRGLAASPEARPASMGALVAELEKAATRRPRFVSAVAIAGTAALVAAAVVFSLRRPPPFRPEVVPMLPIHDEEIAFPAWSPNGRLIAWSSNHDGRDRLWIAPADGSGAPRVVTPPEVTAVFPRWTRDGKAILLLDDHQRLFRVPLDGGAPRLLTQGPRAFADCAGRTVVSLRGAPGCIDCAVLAERGASGDRALLLLPSQAVINDVRCDGAGKMLVYSESGADRHWNDTAAIWTVPLEGGAPRRLTDGSDFDFNATFHPDGRSIVFSRWRKGSARLWEVPAGGGEAVQLTFAEGEDEDKAPDVSPDGRTVLYVHETRTFELAGYSPRNGTRVLISRELENVGLIAATPDGAEIVGEESAMWTPTRRKRIKAWPLRGGEVRDFGEGYHPSVTHDGSQVIFAQVLSDGRSRLVAVQRGGGPERTVAELPGDVIQLAEGPDGVVHVSVRGSSGRTRFRVPIAGGTPQAQPGPAIAFYPSPAGGWAVSVAQRADGRFEGQLIQDGARSPIARFEVKQGSWQGNGEAFVYSDGHDVRRYTLATGEDKVLMPAAINGIASSPDGDTVYLSESHARCVRRLITNFADRPRPR